MAEAKIYRKFQEKRQILRADFAEAQHADWHRVIYQTVVAAAAAAASWAILDAINLVELPRTASAEQNHSLG